MSGTSAYLQLRRHPCVAIFFSSRRRHTRCGRDWSSDVCSSDLALRITWKPTEGGRMLRYSLMLSILTVGGAARADVEPGSWEVSVTTSVPGTPGEIGPVVRTRCLSADDAPDPSRVLGHRGGCAVTNR